MQYGAVLPLRLTAYRALRDACVERKALSDLFARSYTLAFRARSFIPLYPDYVYCSGMQL